MALLVQVLAYWYKSTNTDAARDKGDIPAHTLTSISFDVKNPTEGQEARRVWIESSGLITFPEPLAPASPNQAPLLVGALLDAAMSQTSPFVGMRNFLRISFKANVGLPRGTLVFISGFLNVTSLSVASTQLLVAEAGSNSSNSSSYASSSANASSLQSFVSWVAKNVSWDQRQGLVVLTVTSQLFAHTSYWVSVALVNPMTAQQGLMLSQSYMWADGNCPDSTLILTHDNPSHVAMLR